MSDTPSLYEILELEPTATLKEIKAAWRRLSQKYHPDKYEGDAEKILAINKAYEILKDKRKRTEYDASGTINSKNEETQLRHDALTQLSNLVVTTVEKNEVEIKDLVVVMREVIDQSIKNIELAKEGGKKSIIKFTKAIKRLKVKEGEENILANSLQTVIEQNEASLVALDYQILLGNEILKILSDYSYDLSDLFAKPERPPEKVFLGFNEIARISFARFPHT